MSGTSVKSKRTNLENLFAKQNMMPGGFRPGAPHPKLRPTVEQPKKEPKCDLAKISHAAFSRPKVGRKRRRSTRNNRMFADSLRNLFGFGKKR